MNSKNNFLLVKPGQNLTLTCLYTDKGYNMISWYKQTHGERPTFICVDCESSERRTFSNDFKNNPRFRVQANNNEANLTITNLQFSDSAAYYCAKKYFYVFDFTERFNVVVHGSGLTISQSASEPIQSGGSGTFNCTVHTGTCNGDHTVYWFRNSEPSQLELVYSHRRRNNQCENKTNTCFYNLSLKTLNIYQTGIYFCAVACGHVLFGNTTKMEFEGE